jgi:predicted 3-demethylubiquinone-9 3-methyltransferase (glyoxalase superfamily)
MVKQLITPFLWFENQLEEAVNTYVLLFPKSKITNKVYLSSDSPHAGKVLTSSFTLAGQEFAGINGGSHFKINPSISFYVACKSVREVNKYWKALIEGGSVMLPINKYPWSERYGWLQDRFGMTWQITLDKNIPQKITPSMLFTEGVHGKGREAFEFYTTLFENSALLHASYYQKGQNEYTTEGMVLFSLFNLNGQFFIIMDAGMPQPYTFNEGLSYIINCETQAEVDYYWGKLTENGGQESMCGWCKDKFGVSWQVIPSLLFKLMGDKNAAKAKAATHAMFKMKKMDMAALQKAFDEA